MNWGSILLIAIVVLVLVIARRRGLIGARAALELLKAGAKVIDVRTAGEFASGHLPGALNLPVDRIESDLPRRIPDRGQALLLHCASGMRSSAARSKLRALGYENAFNLGSFHRASRIAGRP
jgi:rhodanese-related sulfurtransferase